MSIYRFKHFNYNALFDILFFGPVAKLDKAPSYGLGDLGFESLQVRQIKH
tara:strand:+ start:610 stop:759 length:150 start_codon:yes stop_codon:yes gene_type:complete